MRIVAANTIPSAQIAACLAAVSARDPFVVPVPIAQVLASDAVVALLDGRPVAVGWRRPQGDAFIVDVRVTFEARRQGIGGALLAHLDDGAKILVNYDVAHPRARRFVEHRGFEPVGMVFHQRWDGEPSDVPPAFKSVRISDDPDPYAILKILADASADSWPSPLVTEEELSSGQLLARIAWVGGERVGALIASSEIDWRVAGFAVLPAFRGRGIGRLLLAELMARAAAEDRGVTMRVDAANERLRAWTGGLGFWTFRTWAYYQKPAQL